MSTLAELYNSALMERALTRAYCGEVDGGSIGKAKNDSCGDSVTFTVSLRPDGRIAEAMYRSKGCAICVGSADLLAEYAVGRTVAELEAVRPTLANIKELAPARSFPTRMKCADLPWAALLVAAKKEPT